MYEKHPLGTKTQGILVAVANYWETRNKEIQILILFGDSNWRTYQVVIPKKNQSKNNIPR